MLELYSDVIGPTFIPAGRATSEFPATNGGPAECVMYDNGTFGQAKYSLCWDGQGVSHWAAASANTIAGTTFDTDLYRSASALLATDGGITATGSIAAPPKWRALPD